MNSDNLTLNSEAKVEKRVSKNYDHLTFDSCISELKSTHLNPVSVGWLRASETGIHPSSCEAAATRGRPKSSLGSYRLIQKNDRKRWEKRHPKERKRRFKSYLSEKKGQKIHLRGVSFENGINPIVVTIPYIHRWTEPYRKKTIAKLYLLEKWYNCHRPPLVMLTLTTYQSGPHSEKIVGHKVSRDEAFKILKSSWKKLLDVLRHEIGKFRYVAIMEPHKSGYPHMHVLLFMEISDAIKGRIERLWSKKYGAGSKEHGVEFTMKPVSQIKSVRNYLLKYLHKSFEYDNNPNYLMFNVIIWENKYRVFTCDRQFSRIMKRYNEESDVTWLATELESPYGDKREMWRNAQFYDELKKIQGFNSKIDN